MLMERTTPRSGMVHFTGSLSFQLLGLLLTAIVAPVAVVLTEPGPDGLGLPTTANSLAASLLAALVALSLCRRVTVFPGTSGFAYIIPVFSGCYGVAVALLLGLRLPYSNGVLATSFIGSTLFHFAATYLSQRLARRLFYLVPHGNTEIAQDTNSCEWIVMSSPELPRVAANAPIVADLRHLHEPAWERMLADAALAGRTVYHTKQLRESLTGKVEIEHLSENNFGSLVPNLAYRKVKRGMDLLVAFIALIALLPSLVILAALIRLDSPGPILFRQERMGYRRYPFTMIKFRTMSVAPEPAADDVRNSAITRVGDQRITRLGRFLRRSRLDELPQLINVLRGEMSVIGPRPEAIALSEWYEQELPFYSYRHIVRPGITGWAQVNQGHVADLEAVHTKLHYDFYYIKNFSAWLDLLITMRTLATMLTGFGSR